VGPTINLAASDKRNQAFAPVGIRNTIRRLSSPWLSHYINEILVVLCDNVIVKRLVTKFQQSS
jgi:hypothetical protein